MGRHPPDPERVAAAREMLAKGATVVEVCRALNISRNTAWNWGLRSTGARGARGKAKGPRGRAVVVVELLMLEVPPSEIAAILKMSRQRVYRIQQDWISDDSQE